MYFLWFLLSLRATTKTCPFLHGSLASLHVKTGGGGAWVGRRVKGCLQNFLTKACFSIPDYSDISYD